MRKKDRYERVLGHFRNEMPRVTTELEFGSVFQLLVAVILSAQCTDKRVNMVTPVLFEHYPDARSMAAAEADELYEYVKSVSYPNSKARHLVEMSRMLVSEYGGEVPQDMAELMKLPGVGRKTANVIQAVAFGRSVIAVDTHVFRVSHRLGLVSKSWWPMPIIGCCCMGGTFVRAVPLIVINVRSTHSVRKCLTAPNWDD